MLARNTATARRPHQPTAGAGAVVLVHVPRCPGRSHRSCGLVQAVSQHTSATQKPVEHCDGVIHAPPWGTGVLVGVAVGVLVTVAVLVAVAVAVAVLVGVSVGVGVGVLLGTGTPSMTAQLAKPPSPHRPSDSLVEPVHSDGHRKVQPSVVKHWGAPLGQPGASGPRHRQHTPVAALGAISSNTPKMQTTMGRIEILGERGASITFSIRPRGWDASTQGYPRGQRQAFAVSARR